MKFPLLLAFAVALFASGIASASKQSELDAAAFSLRLPAALAKFSPYADVAALGGASAGSRYASSVNPASGGWEAPSTKYVLSPQWSRIGFERGAALDIAALSATVDLPLGSIQPAYARIDNRGREQGEFLLIQGEVAQLQWGKKLSDSLAIGANLNASRVDTRAGADGFAVFDGRSKSTGLRLGMLWAMNKQLLAGLVLERSHAASSDAVFVAECLCSMQINEKSQARSARAGISYEYADQSSVYADVVHATFSAPQAQLRSRQLMAGLEHRLRLGLFARAGITRDLRGFHSATVGAGMNLSKTVVLDVAYQRNMFPELRTEFGASRLFNVSLGVGL